jgi:tryptophan synthase beta chain
VHSISAGLDYPGVGPEHSYWHDTGRVEYLNIRDEEALDALQFTARTEGILPAMESSHALAYAMKRAKELSPDKVIVVCLSGRGDKDVNEVARLTGREI